MRFLCIPLLICMALSALANDQPAPLIEVTRIYTGDDKLTHFADGAVALSMKAFAPPTAPIAVSTPLPAKALTFLAMPSGWFGDWHPAPAKQYVIVLQGTFEIETGDGEKRIVKAGSTLLVEDIDGKGHRTRVVSEEALIAAIVPVRE